MITNVHSSLCIEHVKQEKRKSSYLDNSDHISLTVRTEGLSLGHPSPYDRNRDYTYQK